MDITNGEAKSTLESLTEGTIIEKYNTLAYKVYNTSNPVSTFLVIQMRRYVGVNCLKCVCVIHNYSFDTIVIL